MTFFAKGAKSSAFPAALADAIASSSAAGISAIERSVRETEPAAIPPSTATKAMMVMERCAITPFVVSVLFAQRKFAWVLSVITTMQSSEVA